MTDITTRPPVPSDAAAITRIDADGLATGHATFRETPYDWARFSAAFCTGRGVSLVGITDGAVTAWAGVSPTSTRPVYRGVGEVSIYVAADQQGRGLGCRLLEDLMGLSERAGYWTLVAQIFPENEASVSLHTALGFTVIGTRQKLGKMTYGPFEGRWRDVAMLERRSEDVS